MAEETADRNTNSDIKSYFIDGVETEDILPLWRLSRKQHLLDAFITLFRGSEPDVLVRLLVLSEMVSKVDPPSWSMGELRHAFSYFSETAFENVLKRLREGDLITYDRETNSYAVTPLGQKTQSALSLFMKNEEDDGIGMLTGLVFAGEITGTLGKEELEHLLYRLHQLEQEMVSAIESASEHQIMKARQRYESIWQYIEKGTEIIERITGGNDMSRETHQLAQQIGHAQSRLAKFTSLFQRALNEIDRQRVHLGNSGVSTSDLNRYLMALSPDDLNALLAEALGTAVRPVFILADVTADIAEYEIIERERQRPDDWALPEPHESPLTDDINADSLAYLEALQGDLNAVEESASFQDIIPKGSYEESAYRLSMVALIGDRGEAEGSRMFGFISLPLEVSFGEGSEMVMRHGVEALSGGTLTKSS